MPSSPDGAKHSPLLGARCELGTALSAAQVQLTRPTLSMALGGSTLRAPLYSARLCGRGHPVLNPRGAGRVEHLRAPFKRENA